MRIISWNVNGIRSVWRKGFLRWFKKEEPDILCLQETKADLALMPKGLRKMKGYILLVSSGEKKGYSGVAMLSKTGPIEVRTSFGIERFDREGRIQIARFEDFTLCNIYFPNGKASRERLQFKLDFYEAFLEVARGMKNSGEKVIVCGDVNTAHKEIDLARPKENARISGFLPEERAWIDRFVSGGFVDTFRVFDQSSGRYTWWDMKTRARERNVGWRIDYFFVTENLLPRLQNAFIRQEVEGSDHCPVGIDLRDL